MSSAAAATNSRPPAPICPQRRRPTPLPPKTLPNQIPRDREPLTSPADSFFGGFRTPALATAVQIDDRPASETLHDRRPTPLPPKPLPNQIPINREPLTSPRGFLLRRLSDAGPRHGCTNRRTGRHPKPF